MMDILEFLSDEKQHQQNGGQAGIQQRFCVRGHSGQDKDIGVVEGSGFCRACLVYLSGETDEDPLEGRRSEPSPWSAPVFPPGGTDEEWWNYHAASRE